MPDNGQRETCDSISKATLSYLENNRFLFPASSCILTRAMNGIQKLRHCSRGVSLGPKLTPRLQGGSAERRSAGETAPYAGASRCRVRCPQRISPSSWSPYAPKMGGGFP